MLDELYYHVIQILSVTTEGGQKKEKKKKEFNKVKLRYKINKNEKENGCKSSADV